MVAGKEGRKSMNNVIKTAFVGKNPFQSSKNAIDINTIKITNDKPKDRRPTNFKYENLFNQLEIGKALSCLPKDCEKVGQALRSYVKRHNLDWIIKVQANYTKTTGRVFVLPKESK